MKSDRGLKSLIFTLEEFLDSGITNVINPLLRSWLSLLIWVAKPYKGALLIVAFPLALVMLFFYFYSVTIGMLNPLSFSNLNCFFAIC